jgi:hypothetical protein
MENLFLGLLFSIIASLVLLTHFPLDKSIFLCYSQFEKSNLGENYITISDINIPLICLLNCKPLATK